VVDVRVKFGSLSGFRHFAHDQLKPSTARFNAVNLMRDVER
jgi:hypothetical protein